MRGRSGVWAVLAAWLVWSGVVPATAAVFKAQPLHPAVGNGETTVAAVDPGGYLWLATRPGDNATGGVSIVAPDGTIAATCDPGAVVNAIAFDPVATADLDNASQGSVWLATRAGLQVLGRDGRQTRLTGRNVPLPGNHITALAIGPDGTRWLAVDWQGLCCVDADFNWAFYTAADGLCSNRIVSLALDATGRVWCGSRRSGVAALGPDGRWQRFSSKTSGLIDNRIVSICAEPPDRMWFATPAGISVFDGRNWMSYTARNSPLGVAVPTCLTVGPDGRKWIGTEQEGVFCLDRYGSWTRYQGSATGLPSGRVAALAVDPQGTVWVTTRGELSCSRSPADTSDRQPTSLAAALRWQAGPDAARQARVSLALPFAPDGSRPWVRAAVWCGPDVRASDLSVSIAAAADGRRVMQVDGPLRQLCWAVRAGAVTAARPARFVPSRPGVPAELHALAAPGSLGGADAAVLARAIVYDQQVQMPRDASLRAATPAQRARTICGMLQAAGIPSRVHRAVAGVPWVAAWLAGQGWTGISTAYPAYDYVRQCRTGMPRAAGLEDRLLVSMSDEPRISWPQHIAARTVETDPGVLDNRTRVAAATLLLPAVSGHDAPPADALLPVAENLAVYVRSTDGACQLVFVDQYGAEVDAFPLAFDGTADFVSVENRLFWKFLPRRIADVIVLENHACREMNAALNETSSPPLAAPF